MDKGDFSPLYLFVGEEALTIDEALVNIGAKKY